jgi:hypothetical protein
VAVAVGELVVRDLLTGGDLLEWFFPLHPGVEMRGLELWREDRRIGRLVPPAGVTVLIEPAEWRPEFNRRIPSQRIRMMGRGAGEYETRFCFEGGA